MVRLRFKILVCLATVLTLKQRCTSDQGAQVIDIELRGTLSLSGPLAKVSAEALRGLELLVDAVNSSSPFRFRDGQAMRVRLDIRDDAGEPSNVNTAYADMLATRILKQSLVLPVGPVTPELGLVAAKVVSRLGGAIVLHQGGALDQGLVESNTSFFMHMPAFDYFESILQHLQSSRRRTNGVERLVLGWKDNHFNRVACYQGAISHAQALGITVLGDFLLGQSQHEYELRNFTTFPKDPGMKAHVFLGCGGNLEDASRSIVNARATNFHAEHVILTGAADKDFVKLVGASNANYVWSTVRWQPQADSSNDCPVFGSSLGFATAYRKRFKGKEPTDVAASAAAAGFALLAAAARLNGSAISESNTVDHDLVAALQQIDIPSFYGRIRFNENGTLSNAKTYWTQWRPLPTTSQAVDRYFKSDLVFVASNSTSTLPAPVWEKKDLEVYPCDPGFTVIEDAKNLRITCKPCPGGTYREQQSLDCHKCPRHTYSKEGAAACLPCPEGATCEEYDLRDGRPAARAGYFRMPFEPLGEPIYIECKPPSLCAVGHCRGENQGVLCAQCRPGFTNRGRGLGGQKNVCGKCPNMIGNVLFLLFIVCGYGLYIFLIGSITLASSQSVKAIHSIVVKKMINHVQLASTIVVACEFKQLGWLSFFAGFSQDPLEAMVSPTCFYEDKHYKGALDTIAALLLVPVMLSVTFAMITFTHVRRQIRQERNQLEMLSRGELEYEPPGDIIRSVKVGGPDATGAASAQTISVQLRFAGDQTAANPTEELTTSEGFPRLIVRYIQWAIVCTFIVHPIVTKMCLKSVQCVQMDVQRVALHLDLTCDGSVHRPWYLTGFAGIAVFGFGIPGFFFLLMRRVRHNLMDKNVRRMYGFLYNGFDPEFYYFEVVHMLRKVIILMASIAPLLRLRVCGMLLVCCFFLAVHIRCLPYDKRDYMVMDKLEFTSFTACILSLFMRLFFDIRESIRYNSPYVHEFISHFLFDVFFVIANLVFHLYFWFLAVWSLLHNTSFKHLYQKADFLPGLLSRMEKIVLICVGSERKAKYDTACCVWDLSKLGARETDFLYGAFSETVRYYIQSPHPFHIRYVDFACSEALNKCINGRIAFVDGYECVDFSYRKLGLGWTLDYYRKKINLILTHHLEKHATPSKETDHSKEPIGIDPNSFTIGRERATNREGFTIDEIQNALMLCWPEIASMSSSHWKSFGQWLNSQAMETHDHQYVSSESPRVIEDSQNSLHDSFERPSIPDSIPRSPDDGEEIENQIHSIQSLSNEESSLDLVGGLAGVSESALILRTANLENEFLELRAQIEHLREQLGASDNGNTDVSKLIDTSLPDASIDGSLAKLSEEKGRRPMTAMECEIGVDNTLVSLPERLGWIAPRKICGGCAATNHGNGTRFGQANQPLVNLADCLSAEGRFLEAARLRFAATALLDVEGALQLGTQPSAGIRDSLWQATQNVKLVAQILWRDGYDGYSRAAEAVVETIMDASMDLEASVSV